MPESGRVNARSATALSIAGSDSGGGAGIQADLKAFARCGVHGATVLTAITAQSTAGVDAVHPLPSEIVLAQARAVLGDMTVDAVKVGMLATTQVARAVAVILDELPAGTPVVLDPVMVAESGARLLDPDAERILVAEIVPRATVVTPNVPEARVLSGYGEAGPPQAGGPAGEDDEMRALARAVLALGADAVVLTGGHRERAVDLLLEARGGGEIIEIDGERHPDGAAHGSGCTHSSLVAAQLALGRPLPEAARIARALTGEAIAHGLRGLGAGAGPVDVLHLGGGPAR